MKLTAERLRHLLNYDPESGLFTHKTTRNNAVKIGSIAGSIKSDGYIDIKIDGKMHKAHRLAFLWMEGTVPPEQVDHINGVRSDNRWRNLRFATRRENQGNHAGYSGSSGIRGVSWANSRKKWTARITCNGHDYHLGYFTSVEEANACYQGAASLIFGEFAYHRRATPATLRGNNRKNSNEQ